jgi:hypothetical protein
MFLHLLSAGNVLMIWGGEWWRTVALMVMVGQAPVATLAVVGLWRWGEGSNEWRRVAVDEINVADILL